MVSLFLQDDPLKSSMHSFLMSSTHQQEIANLDTKVCIQAGGKGWWVGEWAEDYLTPLFD